MVKFKNPFDVIIPHTTGKDAQHVGLTTKIRMIKFIKSAGFMNFGFHYDINSKIERSNYLLGGLLSETPFLRNIFVEDSIVVIRKPIILSLFP